MNKRRQFLGALTAFGGSYILTACGGGGSDLAAGAAGDAVAKATARASTSANGTTMPPASSIVDNSGNTWTLSGGSVYRNGAKAGNTYNVSLVLFIGGVIYHQGTGSQFYAWNGSAWNASNDPRLGGTSADGTTIPSASYIIDKTGAMWTVVGGVIYRNNKTVGNTYNVSMLLWYGGKIWHKGTGGQFYVNTDVAGWLPCSDPRIATAATAGMFYGINGHYDYTYTPAQLVSIVQGMGCKSYRVGCTDDPKQIAAVSKIAQAFQSAGLTLLVLINQGVYDSNGKVFTSESAAYTRGQQAAMAVANALKAYGVTIYECGNELTRQNATMLDFTNAGTKAVDFNNANWPAMRGVMRGMIDGVKAVQSNAKCGINFCVADIGAADALWDGMQPDGSGGHPKVRWDITTWHNYEVYGDIFNIGTDGSGPGFDLPTYCKARYGVPFIITEWNTGPEKTQAYRASYISSTLSKYYQARKTHNIQAVMYYVLDSGNNTYGVMTNGTALNPPYTAFTGFTKGNADI
ncbi:conserved hypothetical protein [Paraburkholderia sabiae]|jgi:hypothetical protein|uniref:hypothetical protein n=1 Tax=Paraburkholderia sabiae TaxID=273251 RepID=UPI001CAB3FCB|nr:hypothetical protein [Paraburkholderia sabiae]CAG9231750.1 conserved hypothetical protein [Paraburkholderia sabiae]